MKNTRKLLGMMIVATLLIMAQASVSNAAPYSGAWTSNDLVDAFFVEFNVELATEDDSFFMYDWENTSSGLEIFGSETYQNVYFTIEDSTWYAGLSLGAHTLTLGNTLEFGFFFRDSNDTSYFEYELEFGAGDSYILSHEDINIEVLTHDIQPVPIPASALLLGSGIVGLIGFGKRMRKEI